MGHDDLLTGGETGYWAGLMPIGAAATACRPDGGQITPAGSARDAGAPMNRLASAQVTSRRSRLG